MNCALRPTLKSSLQTNLFEEPYFKHHFDGTVKNLIAEYYAFLVSVTATSYHLSVKTGNVQGAGTDANVFVQLVGEHGETGKVQLRMAENTKNKFERGRTDKFKVEAIDIGKV